MEEEKTGTQSEELAVNEDLEEKEEADLPEEEFPKEFTLSYRITEEEYFQFQLAMGGAQIAKNRKRNTLLGWVELILGIVYLVANIVTTKHIDFMQLILSLLLMGMGVYGILFFKYFFEKQLRKASAKQYMANEYFQNEVTVDFYPNKCVEFLQDKNGEISPSENFWHGISGVRSNDQFLMVMLEPKRCLLIPKEKIAEMLEQVETFFNKICEDFEKPRVLL